MSRVAEEVNTQLERIIALGYPNVANMSPHAFRSLAYPLLNVLDRVEIDENVLLVPTVDLVSPDSLISRTALDGNAGFSTLPPRDISSFYSVDFTPPEGPFYIVIDPHTGTAYADREPDVARKLIDARDREPLTMEEGLALVTQFPEWLTAKQGFNLIGSRSADGRVPGIWQSQGAPRLGAVWPMSRHKWLGNAYCLARRGISLLT